VEESQRGKGIGKAMFSEYVISLSFFTLGMAPGNSAH
jgi:hypothetical protein